MRHALELVNHVELRLVKDNHVEILPRTISKTLLHFDFINYFMTFSCKLLNLCFQFILYEEYE